MKDLLWTAPAEADLAAIDDYWWKQDAETATFLTETIREAAERLRELPEVGPVLGEGPTRKWRAGRTSYILIYRLRPDEVEILRVYHDRQDWRE